MATRRKMIAGNWKMNQTAAEAKTLINAIRKELSGCENSQCCCSKAEILVCPPFTSLAAVREAVQGTCIQVGAQNVHWADKGAFTGEISALMLLELGVTHVILGHSERRQYFAESDVTVNQRLQAAQNAGLQAIVCVGETLQEREDGITRQVIELQVQEDLQQISAAAMAGVIIAYEPVWAIGTGRTASDAQAQEVHKCIRQQLAQLYPESTVAAQTRILYGGSMNAGNAAGLLAQPDIDGGLIGGAALKAPDFAAIIRAAS